MIETETDLAILMEIHLATAMATEKETRSLKVINWVIPMVTLKD